MSDTVRASTAVSEPEVQMDQLDQVMALTNSVHTMLKKIKQLERVVRHTATPPPPGYNNDPTLAEKQAILTAKVFELKRHSFLKIMQTSTPPPPAPIGFDGFVAAEHLYPSFPPYYLKFSATSNGNNTTNPCPIERIVGSIDSAHHPLSIALIERKIRPARVVGC